MKALRLAITLVLVSGTLAYATLSGDGRAHDSAAAAKAAGDGLPGLWIHGRVHALYPGAVKRMRVRVRNRFDYPVRVGSIRIAVGHGGPGCGRENLTVDDGRRGGRVGAHDRRVVRIKVWMALEAPQACQGARFPLRFRAKGKRA